MAFSGLLQPFSAVLRAVSAGLRGFASCLLMALRVYHEEVGNEVDIGDL
jgi:hypothetical protein